MKKILLTTTALVGAGLILSHAVSGEAKAEARFNISGAVDFRILVAGASNILLEKDKEAFKTKEMGTVQLAKGSAVTEHAEGDGHDGEDKVDSVGGWIDAEFFVDGPELTFAAENTSDIGLTYGIVYELKGNSGEMDGSDKNPALFDEVYGYMEGEWGRVEVGLADGVEDQFKINGFMGGGHGNVDTGVSRTVKEIRPNGSGDAAAGMDLGGTSGDAPKITYLSPTMYGFQAGVSYALYGNGVNLEDHGIGVGAKYENAFGEVDLKAAVAFAVMLKGDREGIDDDKEKPNMGVNAGVNVGWKGLGVGFGLIYNINDKHEADNNNLAFAVGVNYDYGQGKVGAGFLYSMDMGKYTDKNSTDHRVDPRSAPTTAAPDATKDRDRGDSYWRVGVGADYTITSGVEVRADFTYAMDNIDYSASGDKGDEANSSVWSVVIGTKISF